MKPVYDFSVSTSQDIEECDSAYENKIKNSKCPKKIPENDCNFFEISVIFWNFFFGGYLETKFGTDFSVSGSCNIEEFDFIYENKIQKLQMAKKKIQKMTEISKSCNHFREFFWGI